MSAILTTGGLGFIGSHTCITLINEGFDVVIVDSLVNSSKETLENALLIPEDTPYEIAIRNLPLPGSGLISDPFAKERMAIYGVKSGKKKGGKKKGGKKKGGKKKK